MFLQLESQRVNMEAPSYAPYPAFQTVRHEGRYVTNTKPMRPLMFVASAARANCATGPR